MASIPTAWLEPVVEAAVDGIESPARVAAALAAAIGADQVLTADVDFAAGVYVVEDPRFPGSRYDADVLLTPEGMHPAVTSYLDDLGDRSPRRVSDILTDREWLATVAYQQVFRASRARYQLSLVTELTPPNIGRGWVLTRSSRDFSDADVEMAARILPALAVTAALARSVAAKKAAPAILTWRESEILLCLSLGASAEETGAELHISPRTVRKHLENIYRKLECHDRIHALRKARDLGILGP
ncbi:helix-turn-helix transcriptional regulator [Frondihabitans australicus]|uniref:Regulatory LuxR family protein n=1 Tax=Frondihabitans australicus TaxID=386892 RepID=A0A495IE15_9MICO|nr:LuxR C-terminal-related transcriptional regulator [Frondihabitans australicus]RKR73581.1 regulatory LuxR family protein [Frondihabitans australicus]